MKSEAPAPTRFPAWPLALGLLLCAAIYLPRIGAPLVWDDYGTIVLNHALDEPIRLHDFATQRYYHFSSEQSWRPLATLSYVAIIRAVGKTPWAMRGIHFVLHAINGLLLAAFLQAVGLPAAACCWAAALFWVHPANVETLMCVSFNEEILVTLGLLTMLWAHRKRRYRIAAAGFAWALLSKETGVIGMPLVVACDYFCRSPAIAPPLPAGKGRGEKARAYAVYTAILAVYLWAHFFPMRGPGGEGAPYALPLWERLYYASTSVATAARVFFLPVRLRIEYFALPPEHWIAGAAAAFAAVVTLVVWGWAILRTWNKNPVLALLLLWPLPFLFLTCNLIPVRVLNMRLTAERWMYLPYLGAAGAAGWFVSKKPRWGVALLLFWFSCAWWRARDWADDVRLWSSLQNIYPWCAKADEGLGEAYTHKGMYPEALVEFERALTARQMHEDRVLRRYVPLSTDGLVQWESASLYRDLGRTYLKLQRINDADASFLKACALDPNDGYTYRIMAYRYAERGNFAKALEWTARGLKAIPGEPFLTRLQADAERGKLSFRAGFY